MFSALLFLCFRSSSSCISCLTLPSAGGTKWFWIFCCVTEEASGLAWPCVAFWRWGPITGPVSSMELFTNDLALVFHCFSLSLAHFILEKYSCCHMTYRYINSICWVINITFCLLLAWAATFLLVFLLVLFCFHRKCFTVTPLFIT